MNTISSTVVTSPEDIALSTDIKYKNPVLKRINKDGEMVAYCSDPNLNSREPFYIFNAALYAVKRDYFVKEKRFTADRQIPLIMDKYHSTDVDEQADLIVAEEYFKVLQAKKEVE